MLWTSNEWLLDWKDITYAAFAHWASRGYATSSSARMLVEDSLKQFRADAALTAQTAQTAGESGVALARFKAAYLARDASTVARLGVELRLPQLLTHRPPVIASSSA